MSLGSQAEFPHDGEFALRCRMSAVKAAVSIGNEAQGTMDVTTFGKRHELARTILLDSAPWGERFAWAVVTNVQLSPASPDSDIDFMVASVWNVMAGVSSLD